ncbi:ras-related protein Rab-30 [Macrosteles quadrilineatus]|uniref:ras-related protein Rab-30 n=1 Tax=Macrosteles quadrilineatus TaxID=74068 RepID=UPI0023E2D4D9|nr:ras-related protein Rab-30 [Macrosteles quadrilineatus]
MASVKVPEQKVILCGEFGVGKSSLFRRYAFNSFVTSTSRQSTLGLDHFNKEYNVNGKRIRLQLWDTGGMERVASITSSYYKFAEAAILVFALDNAASFHVLSQHLLDIVTYAENAKIYLCGNKSDLEGDTPQVTEADMENFGEQCHNLISGTFKTSCKNGQGVEEMFQEIAQHLVQANRSRMELQTVDTKSFKIAPTEDLNEDPPCLC